MEGGSRIANQVLHVPIWSIMIHQVKLIRNLIPSCLSCTFVVGRLKWVMEAHLGLGNREFSFTLNIIFYYILPLLIGIFLVTVFQWKKMPRIGQIGPQWIMFTHFPRMLTNQLMYASLVVVSRYLCLMWLEVLHTVIGMNQYAVNRAALISSSHKK